MPRIITAIDDDTEVAMVSRRGRRRMIVPVPEGGGGDYSGEDLDLEQGGILDLEQGGNLELE